MYVFPRKHVHVFQKTRTSFFSKVRQTRFFYVHLRVIKELLRNYLWTKKTTTTKQNHTEPSWFAALKTFFTNERTRFITGLIISILTIYVGLA